MGFYRDSPVTAGNVLVREAIQSVNYVAGVSGWTINADGTFEFSGGTFRGTVVVSGSNNSAITIFNNAGTPTVSLRPDDIPGYPGYNAALLPATLTAVSNDGGTQNSSTAQTFLTSPDLGTGTSSLSLKSASFDGTIPSRAFLTAADILFGINTPSVSGFSGTFSWPFRRSAVVGAGGVAVPGATSLTTVLTLTVPAIGTYDVTFNGCAFAAAGATRPGFMWGGTAVPSSWRFTCWANAASGGTPGGNNGGGTTSFSAAGTPFVAANWPASAAFTPFSVSGRITFTAAGTLTFQMSDTLGSGNTITVVSGTTATIDATA